MAKVKTYNIWLAEISLRGRQTCPSCYVTLESSNAIVSIGEYRRGIYYVAISACRECYIDKINEAFKRGTYKLCVRTGCKVRWLTGSEETITVE